MQSQQRQSGGNWGEKFQAYRDSTAFKDLKPIREKVAKFRTFVVEGLPQ